MALVERHTMSAKTQERLDIQPEALQVLGLTFWRAHISTPYFDAFVSTNFQEKSSRWHVMDTWLETAGLGLVFSAQTFQEPKWSMALNSLHTVERTSHKQLHCPASARKLGSSRAM